MAETAQGSNNPDGLAAAGDRPGTLLGPLRVANFRYLWIGQTISLVGDQFKFVALSWLVLSLTGRSGALGTVLMLQAIPRSILMLAGGVLSDRLHPRTVMLFSDVFRALVVGTIALLTATGRITMTAVYGLALLFGVVHAFFFPAASSITPRLVPAQWLRQANALGQTANQIVLFLAPAVAGFIIARVGTAGGFAVDAASFLVSAVFLVFIVTPPVRAPAGQSPWGELRAGLAVVGRDPVLRTIIVMAAVFFFGYAGATFVGLPVLTKGPLRAGPQGLGVLFSAAGLGALAGGLLAGASSIRRRGLAGSLLIGLMGLLMSLVALTQNVWQAAGLLAATGAINGWAAITYVTLIQQRAPRGYVGRVMGTLMFGIYGLYPVSYALAGWVSEVVGVRVLFVLGGAMIVAAGLAGLTVRELRAVE